MSIRVIVVPHDPNWQDEFVQESQLIRLALGENLVAIHHIGSTAIPTIYAKPVIDMLVEVQHLTAVDQQPAAMLALGYESLGEYGIPGRRYFRKNNAAGRRTHHVHTFAIGSLEVERHLAFRDYLIAHPAAAQPYSDLKRTLAQRLEPHDIEGYVAGKTDLIKAMEKLAIAWRRSQIELIPCSVAHLEQLMAGSHAFQQTYGLELVPGYLPFPDALEYFLNQLQSGQVAHPWLAYLVVLEPDQAVIGGAGFKSMPDGDRCVEIGYSIAPRYQNRGFATGAARRLIAIAKASGLVDRVYAHTLAAANASTQVLQKCGMTWVGEHIDPEDGPVWRWEVPV